MPLAGVAASLALWRERHWLRARPTARAIRPFGVRRWSYCDDPSTAAADGYNVIDDPNPDANGWRSQPTSCEPDLILANGGIDIAEAERQRHRLRRRPTPRRDA